MENVDKDANIWECVDGGKKLKACERTEVTAYRGLTRTLPVSLAFPTVQHKSHGMKN